MDVFEIHIPGFKLRGPDALAFVQYQKDHGMKKAGAMARIAEKFLSDRGYPMQDHRITEESLREEETREESELDRAA